MLPCNISFTPFTIIMLGVEVQVELKMSGSGKSKKVEKATKKGKQKKHAQAESSRTFNSSRTDHIPLINPSNALLTHTNQHRNTQSEHVQP
ncbi:hypothetical protein RIF29_38545 [Crotalaria pallida]|uniref:Uncharacterized protein n=1 Tax=Crotalaria pallida TaxID=3830 RepID=A0AAN9HNV4_CROPI